MNAKLMWKIKSHLPSEAEYLRHEEVDGDEPFKRYNKKIRVFFKFKGETRSTLMSSKLSTIEEKWFGGTKKRSQRI